MKNEFRIPDAVTIEDVGKLKLICDVYLLSTFSRLESECLK
jgi:hypothetical protein